MRCDHTDYTLQQLPMGAMGLAQDESTASIMSAAFVEALCKTMSTQFAAMPPPAVHVRSLLVYNCC